MNVELHCIVVLQATPSSSGMAWHGMPFLADQPQIGIPEVSTYHARVILQAVICSVTCWYHIYIHVLYTIYSMFSRSLYCVEHTRIWCAYGESAYFLFAEVFSCIYGHIAHHMPAILRVLLYMLSIIHMRICYWYMLFTSYVGPPRQPPAL